MEVSGMNDNYIQEIMDLTMSEQSKEELKESILLYHPYELSEALLELEEEQKKDRYQRDWHNNHEPFGSSQLIFEITGELV